MVPVLDTDLRSEADFEEAILSACLRQAADRGVTLALIKRFGLDLAFAGDFGSTSIRWLEIKAFSDQRMGGVGFGNQRGGCQVDFLRLPPYLLKRLDSSVRWCFADLTKSPGTARFSLLTSEQAQRAAMGEIRLGKQNNFRVSTVFAAPTDWRTFLNAIFGFLSIPEVAQAAAGN